MAQGDVLNLFENRPQNYLINGDFAIDQRKVGGLHTTLAAYSLDRWRLQSGTSVQRVAETGQAFKFAAALIATATTSSMTQRIEADFIRRLVGKTVTFSIYIKLMSGAWSANPPQIEVAYANATDNWAGQTQVYLADMVPVDGGSSVPTGTYRRFKYSFIVTQNMADNGFMVRFGDFTSTTSTVRYAQAMLNEGAYAAKFYLAGKNKLVELLHIQKFFCTSYIDQAVGTALTLNGSLQRNIGTGSASTEVEFPVLMRVAPIITVYNRATGAAGTWREEGPNADRALSFSDPSRRSSVLTFASATTGATINGHYTADAEL